ncbi:hypothetical protein BDY21DRAFT_363176 [Lineolata rhizophorae]|uniref:BTB domain-containing protein n=1 Tax=Lineolata rhizophorae TaxID=578093 RepID=A0A6A6P383_9PEZI|nr:hypothetical protein BDY21DRAFT_363176 [Lineolata rhizophorae]
MSCRCQADRNVPPLDAFNKAVIVAVGYEQRIFHIHEGVLRFYSPGLDKMIGMENGQSTLFLPEVDPKVFQVFVGWLYTQCLVENSPESGVKHTLCFDGLIRAYIFGGIYDMPNFQNDVMDALIRKVKHEWHVPVREIKVAYAHTSTDSFLRKFLVDVLIKAVKDIHQFFGKTKRENFPTEYLFDLIFALGDCADGRITGQHAWEAINNCDYHIRNENRSDANNTRSLSGNKANFSEVVSSNSSQSKKKKDKSVRFDIDDAGSNTNGKKGSASTALK